MSSNSLSQSGATTNARASRSGSSNLLRILPESGELGQGSAYAARDNWPPRVEEEGPRALRSLSRIIESGLCHRCGSCVGICPTSVLSLDTEEYPKVQSLSSCTDCNLCVAVCPGAEFDLQATHQECFDSAWDSKAIHGQFSSAWLAHATDPDIREHSTSGGFITGLLIDMLERGEIDGALVIGSDDNVLWKGKPMLARSREELLASMKSKYAISPTNISFAEVLRTPGRYALVGLPCQIHGFRKAAALDERVKERIILAIGLYCHAAVEHDAFRIIWDSLGKERDSAVKYISRVGKHPGTPHTQRKDGSLYPVYFGKKKGYRPSSMELINIIYRLYTPKRCLTCFDASAEFADIAVGDPWMAPPSSNIDFYKGWSFVLARTTRGQQILENLKSSKSMILESLTNREAQACNSIMGTEKRWRAFRVIETKRRQGEAIPAYGPFGFSFPRQSGKQFIKTELHMLTHIFCYLPKYRSPVLRLMLSNAGYALLWLNHKRRWLRFFMRDTSAFVKRKIFGRR